MEIIFTQKEIHHKVFELKNKASVGLVPTMGALHQGHISLITKSKQENDYTVCTIFVNPTQFNNPDDLKNYPRMNEKDIQLLEKQNCDILFLPTVAEMYPEPDERNFSFGYLDSILEGKFRPGHFVGVAQIVSKLFSCIPASNAYFGLKDYQQYMIIKQMTKDLHFNIKIIGCPTLRESDGLAMSSRNLLLTDNQRVTALRLHENLQLANSLYYENIPLTEIRKQAIENIEKNGQMRVEYFDLCNAVNLKSLKSKICKTPMAIVAAWCGNIRLIDNLIFK